MIMNLTEWLNKFADIMIWNPYEKKPTDLIKSLYPYFYTDLLMAWEQAGYTGAREVLNEANRRMKLYSTPVLDVEVNSMWTYPLGVEVIEVTDTGNMKAGYERRWEDGKFMYNETECCSIVWHKHDGSGREPGTVQVQVWS